MVGLGAFGRSVVFSVSACFLACPAVAGEAEMVQVFLSQCVHGGYVQMAGPDADTFPKATRINGHLLASSIGFGADIRVMDAWDLDPSRAAGEGLALLVVLFNEPSLGPMAGCVIFSDRGSKYALEDELISNGAERSAGGPLLDREGRLWIMRTVGWPEIPYGIAFVFGMTPNPAEIEK